MKSDAYLVQACILILRTFAQEFCDLIAMARVIRNSGGRRVVFSIYHAALEFHAVKVLYYSLSEIGPSLQRERQARQPEVRDSPAEKPDGLRNSTHHLLATFQPFAASSSSSPSQMAAAGLLDTTLADLLDIAHKSLAEDPSLVYRYTWPLTVALLKTGDAIHREWIRGHLLRAHTLVPDPGGLPRHHITAEDDHGINGIPLTSPVAIPILLPDNSALVDNLSNLFQASPGYASTIRHV
jgi:hypothetical protein